MAAQQRQSLSGPAGKLEAMSIDREALYAEVADVVIDVDGFSPEDVAARILEHLGSDA